MQTCGKIPHIALRLEPTKVKQNLEKKNIICILKIASIHLQFIFINHLRQSKDGKVKCLLCITMNSFELQAVLHRVAETLQ